MPGTAREIGSLRVRAGQRAIRYSVTVDVEVPIKRIHFVQVFRGQNLAPIVHVILVPLELRHHPVIHADIEVGQDHHGRLQAVRQIECLRRHRKTLVRVGREQQDVFGVAVRCIGATQDVGLLGSGRHAR